MPDVTRTRKARRRVYLESSSTLSLEASGRQLEENQFSMPPRKRAADDIVDYDSDGGFVEDASKSSKRTKSAGNELKKQDGVATVNTEMQHDDDGNEYWEVRIGRIQVQIMLLMHAC